jgi:ATP-dependent RNA helicase DDX3X
MADALLNTNTNGHTDSGGGSGKIPADGQAAQAAQAAAGGSAAEGTVGGGWAPSQKYDYDQFADSRGGDFDGNKRVYHWNGEEGDLGPEFPELEEELFGPADKRELPSGIDFSR